mgnify:CR=1 FL=1
MTWVDVDDMTVSNLNGYIASTHENVRDLSGNLLLLSNHTKSGWSHTNGWQNVKDNNETLLQEAINELKSNYAGKEIDTDGLYITYEEQ